MDAYQCDICAKYFLYQPQTKTAYADCGSSQRGTIIVFIDFTGKQDLCPTCKRIVVKRYIKKISEQLENGESFKTHE